MSKNEVARLKSLRGKLAVLCPETDGLQAKHRIRRVLWQLYIEDAEGNRAHNMYFSAADKAFLRDTGFGTYDTDYSTGINYGDDVVFYFSNAGSNETSLKFLLQIYGGDTYIYTTTKIPEAGNAYTLPAITDTKWTKLTNN